jgi:UDP-N-acetylmuramate dehydrogenase
MKIEEVKDLSRYSRIGIGGKARFFFHAQSNNECIEALEFAYRKNVPVISIGEGSNISFEDGVVEALVLKVFYSQVHVVSDEENSGYVSCDGGMRLQTFVSELAKLGIDASNFAGIMGTVAGAIVNNSGSNNDAIGNYLLNSTIVDSAGNTSSLSVGDMRYGVRDSALRSIGDCAVMRCEFHFPKGCAEEILSKIALRLSIRRYKQPKGLTLGSTFRNPSECKLTAGQLIEMAGFKGYRKGNLVVALKHANWLINLARGVSTAKELRSLLDDIREEVLRLTGIQLEEEIQIIGKMA